MAGEERRGGALPRARRWHLLVAAAAVAVALSGCRSGALPPTASPTPTGTPPATSTPSTTPTPSSTPTPTFPADAIVVAESLNLRTGPEVSHPVIDILTAGTAVAIRGRSHDDTWLAVRSPDLQEGWLSARHVRLRRQLAAFPTQVTPTPPPTRTPTPVPADPSAALVLAPPVVAQGDPLLVRLRAADATQAVASLLDATVPLFPAGSGAFAGLLPVPADVAPGQHLVHLTAVDGGGNPRHESIPLQVLEAPFADETITLGDEARALLDPALRERETAYLAQTVWSAPPSERLWSGTWQRPLTVSVSSPFGARRAYNGEPASDRHVGVDLRGGVGTVVRSPADGRVVLAEELAVRGNTVWLDHGWGVHSGYFHLETLAVTPGDVTEAGTILGTVGRTGRATGPHLHWEVRVAGTPVQPLEFLLRDVGAVP